ncbi:MAG: polyphosphate kinase 2 [Bacteroidia bacterium]
MEEFKVSDKELKKLSTKKGLRALLYNEELNLKKAIRYENYERTLEKLQVELVQLQTWVINNGHKVVCIFEGRDAAGKGGAIRRITHHLNPRHYRMIALPKPTEEEASQWYFQRYSNHLPMKGEMVFFDRSWYNRAVVEPVNGFCSYDQYERFMNQVNDFESMLVDAGITLIKFYFSISKQEQAKRFADIESNPLKRWKMSPVDEKAQDLWDEYTKYKEAMFAKTDTEKCPWIKIEANRKTKARIEAIEHLLKILPQREQYVIK